MENKLITQTVYVPVDLCNQLPINAGWYNLITDADPESCGRAFFDGKKFKFSSSAAVAGIIESGKKIYWLEKKEDQIVLSKDEFNLLNEKVKI